MGTATSAVSPSPGGQERRLPSGTVTLLFTDLQGSTRLVERLGAGFAAVLGDHFSLLRRSVTAHGGDEFGTEGDALFAVFARARDALCAAAEAQRALAAHPWPPEVTIRVRMGLHTGTPDRGPGSYVGHDVHRAARIAGAAHGGQVLLSSATRTLATPLPPGLATVDLGRHRLKDLSEPEHLFQLTGMGLIGEFPPLRSKDVVPTNLPVERTSFVGRQVELDELVALMRQCRLVTLTGSGGTGKTRLALRLARHVLSHFPDGVWIVRLAEIQDPSLVGAAITGSMGLAGFAERGPIAAVAEYTRGQRHLLLLDNFEHVVAAAGTVADLLDQAPGVSVLVTSREVLQVHGEQAYAVATLPLPAAAGSMRPEGLSEVDAVRLFVERARAVLPDFDATEDNAAALVEIAHRLEGLPLAIELAAARVSVLSPQELATRLQDGLGVLTGGSRDLPERQRTLRAAIAWSHELLTVPERRLLERLSVFAAPVLLSTAEQVCTDGSEPVLDLLTALVNKSFLRRLLTPDGRSRFAMLESVKDYVREVAEDLPRCRDEHARHYEALAAEMATGLFGPQQREQLDRAEEEAADVSAAIGWCLEQDDPNRAARIAVGMHGYWRLRAQITTARHLVRRVLAGAPADPVLRARLLLVGARLEAEQGAFAQAQADLTAAETVAREHGEELLLAQVLSDQGSLGLRQFGLMPDALADEAMAAFRRVRDPVGEGELRIRMGTALVAQHRREEAVQQLEQALTLMRSAGNAWGEAHALNNLGYIASVEGRFDQAEGLLHSSLELFEGLRTPEGISEAAESLAEVRMGQGRLDEAVELLERALELARELSYHPRIAVALTMLAWCRAHLGDLDAAAGDALRAVELSRTLLGDLQLGAIESAAAVLAGCGCGPVAARLLAAAARAREEQAITPTPLEARLVAAEWTALQGALGPEDHPPPAQEGRVLTVEEALDTATRELRRAQPAW